MDIQTIYFAAFDPVTIGHVADMRRLVTSRHLTAKKPLFVAIEPDSERPHFFDEQNRLTILGLSLPEDLRPVVSPGIVSLRTLASKPWTTISVRQLKEKWVHIHQTISTDNVKDFSRAAKTAVHRRQRIDFYYSTPEDMPGPSSEDARKVLMGNDAAYLFEKKLKRILPPPDANPPTALIGAFLLARQHMKDMHNLGASDKLREEHRPSYNAALRQALANLTVPFK
jgi:hypothetical protein